VWLKGARKGTDGYQQSIHSGQSVGPLSLGLAVGPTRGKHVGLEYGWTAGEDARVMLHDKIKIRLEGMIST